MPAPRRFATACGFVGPPITIGAIVLATVVAPAEAFSWRGHALSDLGRPDTNTFWLFNGGLILGGLVGSAFVWRVWVASRNRLEAAGAAVLAVAVVGLIGVGVFFLEHTTYYGSRDFHGLAALVTFAASPLAPVLYGIGAIRADDRQWGLASVVLGAVIVASWVGWIAVAGSIASRPYFAVQELLAAVLFSGWIVAFAWRLWVDTTVPAVTDSRSIR